MAAVITHVVLKPNKFTITPVPDRVLGTGAPADSDELVVNVTKYPISTFYYDTDADVLYFRKAVTGEAADFVAINPPA